MNRAQHTVALAVFLLGALVSVTGCVGPADVPSAQPPACERPAVAATSLDSAPGVEWVAVGRSMAPSDPEGLGPAVVMDGFGSCWEHSPEGAAMFVANFFAQETTDRFREHLPSLYAEGTVRDSMTAEISSWPPADSDDRQPDSFEGVRISDYSSEGTFTVDTLQVSDSGSYARKSIDIVWVDGDWRLAPRSEGPGVVVMQYLDSASGYLLWSDLR